MNFYIAKMVFRIEVDREDDIRQFEEKIILVKAPDSKKAFEKTISMGLKEESEFVNANGHLIRWKLEGITHISKLMNISEETEIFSELKDDYSDEQTDIIRKRIDIVSKKFININ
jgi:hypothetical protein